MNSKRVWSKYHLRNYLKLQINRVSGRILHKTFSFTPPRIKRQLMALDETQALIRQIIQDGKPALIARFGSNEARCTAEGIGVRLMKRRHMDQRNLNSMHINAGLFPYGEKMALRFSEISEEAAGQVDLLGWWPSFMQDYLALEVCKPDIQLTKLAHLEPYHSNNPWSSALKGKRVLVIHPFQESIEKQYQKRHLLFRDPNILPEFELTVIKAVQTIAGERDDRFETWEDALNFMCEEAMRHEFDVAIIGCGAYGMPLGAMLKQRGKIAIHLGGATQLLFGIKGSRWDHRTVRKLYNEHWVRPSESETPSSYKRIENGCYW